MRRLRSLGAFALLAGLAACVGDTTAPFDQAGLDLQFSLVEPANVSAEETSALADAFDEVDRYAVVVMDATTLETIADTIIDIESGGSIHALNVVVPDDAFGRTVTITLIAYSGELELYRSTQTLILEESLGSLPVELEIRYTGPGVRGQILDEDGDPVGGVTVDLVQIETVFQSTTTEDDGTYLFVDLPVGASYQVVPAAPGESFLCPSARDVTIETADAAIIADFRTEPDPCGVEVLVISGGDFDDTPEVVALLEGDPTLTVRRFYYLNLLPTPELLNDHDVVLLLSNGLFDESASLGNRIRDYVNLGGNVVTTSFYWQNRFDGGFGSTGWGSLEQIDPMESRGGANYSTAALGNVMPHPLTTGLTALSTTTFWGGVAAKTGAGVMVAATWDDEEETPMVAYRVLPGGQRIVGVSLFPAIGEAATGDVAVLFQNAVNWAGSAGGPVPD